MAKWLLMILFISTSLSFSCGRKAGDPEGTTVRTAESHESPSPERPVGKKAAIELARKYLDEKKYGIDASYRITARKITGADQEGLDKIYHGVQPGRPIPQYPEGWRICFWGPWPCSEVEVIVADDGQTVLLKEFIQQPGAFH